MRWPIAAEATSGIACTRSVPTISSPDNLGYRNMSITMIKDPLPTT